MVSESEGRKAEVSSSRHVHINLGQPVIGPVRGYDRPMWLYELHGSMMLQISFTSLCALLRANVRLEHAQPLVDLHHTLPCISNPLRLLLGLGRREFVADVKAEGIGVRLLLPSAADPRLSLVFRAEEEIARVIPPRLVGREHRKVEGNALLVSSGHVREGSSSQEGR